MKTLHWYFPWATASHLYNMTGKSEKLQQLHCYHRFSDSLDIYLTKNHYDNYSPKMVPIAKIWGSGSWTKPSHWNMLSIMEQLSAQTSFNGSRLTVWQYFKLQQLCSPFCCVLSRWFPKSCCLGKALQCCAWHHLNCTWKFHIILGRSISRRRRTAKSSTTKWFLQLPSEYNLTATIIKNLVN